MNAEIITVGTELLLGDILNSNSQFLSRELAAYGIELLYQSTVGDNTARLKRVLALALERSDLVLITGGLGPTPDDLTRETVCETLGLPLVLHEESWKRIQEYFASTGREMTENNQKQAMLPEGCTVFPNDYGTAPGCAIERDGHVVILLPGPPKELVPMFQTYVAPYLSAFSGGTIFSQTIGVFGIPESTVAERLADLLSGANPTVAPYAKDGEVTLRVTAQAENVEAARALCAPVVEEIRSRLGANVYGVNSGSLQKAVVDLLREKGKKIATAESCTAGMLSGRLTEVAGASAVFECGVAAYSKEIKHQVLGVSEELLEKYGAVSPEVASAMAVGARRVGQADLGVGITGVAGPDTSEGKPVGTVYIALADEKRTWVKKIVAGHSTQDREYVRFVATSHALDLVRRYLEALPAVMAGGETLGEPEPVVPIIPVAPKTGTPRRFLSTILPWKGDTRKERIGKCAIWAAVLAVLVAGCLLFNHFVLVPVSNRRLMDRLADIYAADTSGALTGNLSPEDYPAGMSSRFYGLYNLNQDIAGWIRIDDTHINYPVMQDPGDDFYKTHNFEGRYSRFGVPYFHESATFVSPDSVNRSLVIFGNNNQDDQSFSELMNYYSSMEFLRTHAVFEMDTIYQDRQWKIFGVMIVDKNDASFSYVRSQFDSDTDFMQFVTDIRNRSLYNVPVEVSQSDALLLLSTPAHVELGFPGAELVIAARAVREGEAATSDLTGLAKNNRVLMPEAWRELYAPDSTQPVPQEPVTTTTAEATEPSSSETQSSETENETMPGDSTTRRTQTQTTVPITGTQTGQTGTTATTTSGSGTTSTTGTTKPSDTEPTDDAATPPASTIQKAVKPESAYLANFRLRDKNTGKVLTPTNKEELQEALTYVVKGEMGYAGYAKNTTAAIEAQAVATYTYILYYCRDGGTYEYEFPTLDLTNANDKKIYDAVGRVTGYKILDTKQSDAAQAPILAQYFASSPGVTANCENVFVTALPYLKAVDSLYDTSHLLKEFIDNEEKQQSTFTITLADFETKLLAWAKNKAGNDVTVAIESPKADEPIYATKYDTYNGVEMSRYVVETNVTYTTGGKKTYLRGEEIREVMNTAVEGTATVNMRSHCFRVSSYDAASGTMTFLVTGAGHGVGMSQYGAVGYANISYGEDADGNPLYWTYDQILTHYYSITSTSDHQIVAPQWGAREESTP